nr:serine/arginine repetitive matrix protein 2-like [Ipomoea batatas]
MSDSNSQNVSSRDYDEGDEAVSESFSPSTGGSTFNQIDEVEHVSPIAEENEGPLRTTASTEDVSSSGRGKSPRVVVSKMFPHLSPRHRGGSCRVHTPKGRPSKATSPRAEPGPRCFVPTSRTPGPGRSEFIGTEPPPIVGVTRPSARSFSSRSACSPEPRPTKSTYYYGVVSLITFPKLTRTLTDAAAKISSEVYDYLIFPTPEGYKNVNLESPDYGRSEKYEPVPIVVPAVKGMSPDRTIIALASAPRPKTKGGGAAPDLPVTLGPSRQGKEKRQEAEIEEVLTLKRTKRPSSTRSSDLHEGLRERDALASTLVDQIREKVSNLLRLLQLTHTTTDLFSRARALEGIQEKEVVPLQKQVVAAERRIQELEKELAAAEDRAEKAEKKLGEAEGRAERAEQAEKEAIDKMKDASSLARFICTDEAIAKEFLTAFINTEVGDKLTWVYGQWAFSSGFRAIQEQVHTALTEGLEETDLPVVLALLPSEVANPGPRPYSKPGPSE